MSSSNLIKLYARRASPGRVPSPLDLLKGAVADHGELHAGDLRAAAAATGLPEAALYGTASFYDELAPGDAARTLRVCSGTACWAAGGSEQRLLLEARAAEAGSPAAPLGEVCCLGYCHAAPAYRSGGLVDAGPGACERLLAGAARPAPGPLSRSLLAEPVLLRPGDFSGLRRVLGRVSPERFVELVAAAGLRGRGGAGFPTARKWQLARAAPGSERFLVVNGDEGDPGSYIDKYLMEQNPNLLLEGAALAAFATGAAQALIYVRSEYPQATRTLTAAVAAASGEGLLGPNILGSGFSLEVTVVEGAGSYVVGEETALIASLHGLRGTVAARPPYPAERGYLGQPTVVNNVETLCNLPFIASHGAEAFIALSPGASPGSKLVCLNSLFERPGLYELPLGTSLAEVCLELGGGLRGGSALKAVQIGGPLGGLLPADRLDVPLDFAPLAELGCMLGHGSIVGFSAGTDMRALALHLLEFGARESCGKCFPCRVGLRRAYELVARPGPLERGLFEELLETLELASLCGHGSGMPAPLRSLLSHFPDEFGAG